MKAQAIHTFEEFQQFSQEPGLLFLFKFSPWCPVSHYAEAEANNFLNSTAEAKAISVDVVKDRPLSRAIAEATGIKHESPQLLLYKDGQIVWHTSHGEISQASLKAAFLQYS